MLKNKESRRYENTRTARETTTVQRGQEVDKSVMNASTYLYVCQHNTEDDVRYMAKKLGVAANVIPRVPLKFMIWSPSKGVMTSGYVKFNANGKPVFIKDGKGAKRLGLSAVCGYLNGLNHR